MKKQAGMTLIEVMVALVVFALAGLAVMQATLQQTRQLGRMEEKTLAGWLADNQLVQLRLENRWPALSWSETTVQAAGVSWHIRWQGWRPTCRSCGRWTLKSAAPKAIKCPSLRCAPT
jgi:general secretion pathway protein I